MGWCERGLFDWWEWVGPRPLAAGLPSPWDPLLISPWEGEGNGRERGRLLWERVLRCWGLAVREPGVGLRERRRVVVGWGVLVNFGHPPASLRSRPPSLCEGGEWRALAGFPRPGMTWGVLR